MIKQVKQQPLTLQVCKLLQVLPPLVVPEEDEEPLLSMSVSATDASGPCHAATPRAAAAGTAHLAQHLAQVRASRQRTMERVAIVQHLFARILDVKHFGSVLMALQPMEQVGHSHYL